LLGVPHQLRLTGRMADLSTWARDWYAEHGQPWVYTQLVESFTADKDTLDIEGTLLKSPALSKSLLRGEAHSLVLAATSAGPALEAEAQRLWDADKPDEYFFLTVYGSAVVEHLNTIAGAQLCAWAEEQHMAILPHYSPGYPGWDISDQHHLRNLIRIPPGMPAGASLTVMESGMLQPKKSQLAIFGVTRRVDLVEKLSELTPCERCPLADCQYRRKPYRISADMAEATTAVKQAMSTIDDMTSPTILDHNANYALSHKVLRRWSEQRMDIQHQSDGRIVATFFSEGSTCSNLGMPLAFDHTITLAPRKEGYLVRDVSCKPASRHDGAEQMCSYLEKGDAHFRLIDEEKYFIGQPLNAILSWSLPVLPAGCYCEKESRNHKWRNAFQTLHYALVNHEKNAERNAD